MISIFCLPSQASKTRERSGLKVNAELVRNPTTTGTFLLVEIVVKHVENYSSTIILLLSVSYVPGYRSVGG